jgi:predicted aminopeptidase
MTEPRAWRPSKSRKWLVAAVLALVVLSFSGCETLSFYGQALKGQYQIVANRQPIEKVVASPETPSALRARLELVEKLCKFAKEELKLPVDGHYQKYVDVHRPYVVWNVEATKEFTLEPKTWWYPLVGRLEYRGYFTQRGATNYGRWLEKKGYDVYVAGVQAYSTLGWFKDPVLNTFIHEPDGDLAEIIFHELGHQRVFARSDTDFNEAFATTVGQEGARRWLRAQGDTAAYERYNVALRRNGQFVRLIMNTRVRLAPVYGEELTPEGQVKPAKQRLGLPRAEQQRQKEQVLEDMKKQFAQLKAEWGGKTDYDGWFANHLNNAQLNSVAAYYDFVPGFEQLLAANGGALEAFYQAAEKLARKPKKERQESMRLLGLGRP